MSDPDAPPGAPAPGLSRRQVLRASLIGGIAVYIAPLGARAYAALLR